MNKVKERRKTWHNMKITHEGRSPKIEYKKNSIVIVITALDQQVH